jgi:hypothetical protein
MNIAADIMIQQLCGPYALAAIHGLTTRGWKWIKANLNPRHPVPRIPQMFVPELVRRMENEGLRVKFPQALFDQAESAAAPNRGKLGAATCQDATEGCVMTDES